MIERETHYAGPPPDVVDPLLGKVLNERFRVIEALGSGGMGRVYKAMQAPLDRLVALKVLNPQYSDGKDPGFQKRFFLEASVTARLRHPNTVTVIDYGKTNDGIFYIAMEYLEGLTLAQLLTQTGPLPWPRALTITQQVARSLREAHKVGLIHRDLKPANIMVLNQEADHDVVKVLDFGLVKSMVGDTQFPQETGLTQAGVILGSPQYMAPEQARNVTDARSDVYSLGVVLYQILLGRPPFQAQQSLDVIFKHLNETPPSFASVWPGHNIPPEVEALVLKCLAKRPAERFQSMDEFIEGMRRASSVAGYSGAFSSPRPAFGSGPHSGVHSGVLSGPGSGPASGPTSGPGLAPGSGPTSGPTLTSSPTGANTVALDISVEEPLPQKGGKGLMVGVALGCLLLGGGAAVLMMKKGADTPPESAAAALPTPAPAAPQAAAPPAARAPAPQAVAAPSVATPPAQADEVRFIIASEPSGARVVFAGKELGETPLELQVPPGAAGRASAELTFTLDGYQRATVTAAGEGPEVRFTHKLTKKKPSSRPKGSSGYKDDPYL